MELNELGALCMGLVKNSGDAGGDFGWTEWWEDENGARRMHDPPDITLSDPPTDAQKLAVPALKDRAIEQGGEDDSSSYADVLADVVLGNFTDEVTIPRTIRETRRLVANATLRQVREAALRTLVPIYCPEHTDELSRLLERA